MFVYLFICLDEKMSPVLFAVIWANAMIKGLCAPIQSWSDRAERGRLDVPDSNLLIHNNVVYHLVNTSLSFEHAQHHCCGQSSSLTTSGVKEDEKGARQLLSKSNLKDPVWFRTSKEQSPTSQIDCEQMSLKTVKPQEKECEVFNGWSDGQPQYSTAPCTHTLPFICRMSKDYYLKKKDLRESLTLNPSPFMQSAMQNGVVQPFSNKCFLSMNIVHTLLPDYK